MTSNSNLLQTNPVTVGELLEWSGVEFSGEFRAQAYRSIPESCEARLCPAIHAARNDFLRLFGTGEAAVLKSYLERLTTQAGTVLGKSSPMTAERRIRSSTAAAHCPDDFDRMPANAKTFVSAALKRLKKNL